MPVYEYHDKRGHSRTVIHRMLYSTAVVCECGLTMWRVPQVTRINWNGNRAGAETSPLVRQMIDDAPRGREEFAKEKEAHVKKTKAETDRLKETDPTYGTVHAKE